MSRSKRRHAEYYLSQVSSSQKGKNWFERKWPQISQQAWRWVSESNQDEEFLLQFVFTLNPLIIQHGPWRAGFSWNQHTYKRAQKRKDSEAQLEALLNMAWFCNALGQRKEAIRYFRKGLGLAQSLHKQKLQASILSSLGAIQLYMGEYAKGRNLLEKSLRLREAIGDSYGKALSLNNIGESFLMQKRADLALPYFEEAKAILNEKQDDENYALILNNLASAYYGTGSVNQARLNFEEALRLRVAIGDLAGELSTRNNLAAIHFGRKDFKGAGAELEQALQSARALHQKRGEAIALNNLGYLYLEVGENEKATRSFQTALETATLIQETGVVATAREGLEIVSSSGAKKGGGTRE
jgi:tetratricopeptide (TPR) repeat protein